MSRAFGMREDGGVRFRRVSQAFCLGYDVAALQAAGAGGEHSTIVSRKMTKKVVAAALFFCHTADSHR